MSFMGYYYILLHFNYAAICGILLYMIMFNELMKSLK